MPALDIARKFRKLLQGFHSAYITQCWQESFPEGHLLQHYWDTECFPGWGGHTVPAAATEARHKLLEAVTSDKLLRPFCRNTRGPVPAGELASTWECKVYVQPAGGKQKILLAKMALP